MQLGNFLRQIPGDKISQPALVLLENGDDDTFK